MCWEFRRVRGGILAAGFLFLLGEVALEGGLHVELQWPDISIRGSFKRKIQEILKARLIQICMIIKAVAVADVVVVAVAEKAAAAVVEVVV